MPKPQRFPASIGSPPAIDDESVAIHEAACLAVSQKQDRLCDVIGRGKPGHGHASGDVTIGVASGRLIGNVHLCFHPARTDRIDTDTPATPFGGEGAGEPDEAMLEAL